MRLADAYDGFLFDLDGVVWLDHDLIPGAAETLNALIDSGKPVAFVTNNPRISPAEQAEVLRRGGIAIEDRQVVTAASTLIDLALERLGPRARVIATGTASFLDQVQVAGIELLEHEEWRNADAVLVTGHVGFDYGELRAAAMAVRNGALLAATGRDPTMPMPDGLWPGTGSILAAIETASGKTGVITGKPETAIFKAGLEAMGADPTTGDAGDSGSMRVAMFGDRLDTDVGGAQASGIDGILVTGDTPDHEASGDPEIKPDHVIRHISDLLD